MKKRRSPVARCLLRNANAALLAAIEIHNKPVFAYRYEVCVLLTINAWELLLKAYIHKFDKRTKLFRKDGTTKDFPSCLACVASNLGGAFEATRESLENLYTYRNNTAHFYWDKLELILFSLLRVNILFYAQFVERYFGINLAEKESLVLLPIGFSKPFSPLDFLSDSSSLADASREVKEFVQAILASSKRLEDAGIKDSILVEFSMHLGNEKRLKNADVIAGITNDKNNPCTLVVQNVLTDYRPSESPNAKEVKISEESLFVTTFTEDYAKVLKYLRSRVPNFKQNQAFYDLMRSFKGNPALHRARHVDVNNPKSSKKDWYSKAVYEELEKHYLAASAQSLSLDDF